MLLGSKEIASAVWFALQTWGDNCFLNNYWKLWVQTSQEEEMTGAQDGRRDVPLLVENRMIHWSPETDLNWSCIFISVQMKHPAPTKTPAFSKSFLLGWSHPSPQWKASCTLKHVFQLEDLPLVQPYVPLFVSGILSTKLPNLLRADGQQPSSKCVLLQVHKHVAPLSACRSKNLHRVLQSLMFYSLGSVWSSGIWEWHLSDACEHSAYLLTQIWSHSSVHT